MKEYFVSKIITTCKTCKKTNFFLILIVGIIFTNHAFTQNVRTSALNSSEKVSRNIETKISLETHRPLATSCDKVYASGFSSGNNAIYELNGAVMTPVFIAPQNVGGLAVSANGKAYYDNGSFLSSPLFSSDLISQTNTGAIVNSMIVGEVADATGNVFFIDSGGHLRKNVFGSTGISTDLGLITFDAGDTIGPTLAYGDMAFDGNGRLYWYSSVFGTGTSYLYVIDTATLKALNLGNIGPDGATGLAFDAAGKLVTTSNWGSTVVLIDLSLPTLEGTVLGTANPSVYDLGSCAAPLLNPNLAAVKSVANITSGANPATVAKIGDVLEYTIVVSNIGNLMSNNSYFVDAIPALTTYVPASTTINGNPIADIAGNMPFASPALINSSNQLSGIINVGTTVTITFRVTVNANVVGTISNTATVSYPITSGGATTNQSNNSNTVTVVVPPIEVTIYNHFTPNGDGNNEFFFIEGIENFPNNTVQIYNRWGVLVYETEGYNNTDKIFKGESKGRGTIQKNEQLPEGTYYYILKYLNANKEIIEKASYLYINR